MQVKYANFIAPLNVWNFAPLRAYMSVLCYANFWFLKCFDQYIYVGVHLTFHCSKSFCGSFGALLWKWPATWKCLAVERKGVKFRNQKYLYKIYLPLNFCSVQCHFGVIWYVFDMLELFDIGSTFDFIVFKVIIVSFGALVSKWHVTRKWVALERNRVKFTTVYL